MSKYRVYFSTMAEYSIVVEAEDGDSAIESAFYQASFPYFSGGMDGDLGDWNTLSETIPGLKPEDDYELVDDE